MMRKIVLIGAGPTVGTSFAEGVLVPYDISDSDLDDMSFEASVANAEMYGYQYDPDCEGDYETQTNGDDLDYRWEDYNPEEHDGLFIDGCNPFEEERNLG